MRKKTSLICFLVSILSLPGCSSDRKISFIFLVIEKNEFEDGLYLNQKDPTVLIQTYSREVVRYFAELDTNSREEMDYKEAYKVYKNHYVKSYFTLLPTDLTDLDPGTGSAILIDTLRKKAYNTNIVSTTVMY